MNETLSLTDWLNQQPLEAEIRLNDDGSRYIPIEFIKPKLNYLSPEWNTCNFNHQFIPYADGKLICSGSVELFVNWVYYSENATYKKQRTITGSATFFVEKYAPNMNWGATCLSLCIVNAAKELGVFFGKDLNKEIITEPTIIIPKLGKNKLENTLKSLSKK